MIEVIATKILKAIRFFDSNDSDLSGFSKSEIAKSKS